MPSASGSSSRSSSFTLRRRTVPAASGGDRTRTIFFGLLYGTLGTSGARLRLPLQPAPPPRIYRTRGPSTNAVSPRSSTRATFRGARLRPADRAERSSRSCSRRSSTRSDAARAPGRAATCRLLRSRLAGGWVTVVTGGIGGVPRPRDHAFRGLLTHRPRRPVCGAVAKRRTSKRRRPPEGWRVIGPREPASRDGDRRRRPPRRLPAAARPPVALYVHIPFCVSVCPYCDFVVYAGRCPWATEPGRTFAALRPRSASVRRPRPFGYLRPAARPPLDASTSAAARLPCARRPDRRLLDLGPRRSGCYGAEITLEVNPGLTSAAMGGLARAGVTRLSIGAQSLTPPSCDGSAGGTAADVADGRRGREAGRLNRPGPAYDVPGRSMSWRATLDARVDSRPTTCRCTR